MCGPVRAAFVFGDQRRAGELDQLRTAMRNQIEDRAAQTSRDRFEVAKLEIPVGPFTEAEIAGRYPVGEFVETSGRPARRASFWMPSMQRSWNPIASAASASTDVG